MRLMANWFLKPNVVKKDLGIKVKIDRYADWQELKKFEFGTLAYDYEEGLKFETDEKKLPALVEFIRKFHSERTIPFEASFGALFTVHCCDSRDWKKFPPVAKKAGLELDKEYKFVANMTK